MSERSNPVNSMSRTFNDAMERLTRRADLENHPISRALICELLQHEFMKFDELHASVCDAVMVSLTEKNFRSHIEFVNEKFRLINNMDVREDITIAQIYEITVEIDGQFYTRFALVHNIRKPYQLSLLPATRRLEQENCNV